MTAALVAGALVGTGLWIAGTGLWPARIPLTDVVARIGATPAAVTRFDRDARLGAWARTHITPLEALVRRRRMDLRVLGQDTNTFAARILASAGIGCLWGPCLVAGLALAGIGVGWVIPLWAAALGAVIGAAIPVAQVRRQAAQRRAEGAHALGAFCDLVSLCLAGGMTIKQATDTAAASGQGWAFVELRTTLAAAWLDGEHPWDALAALGADTGLDELSELAAALTLAGEEGAAVRATVRQKARVIRARSIAAIEQAGAEATERMTLPSVLLALGFLAFWGYPALSTLTGT